MSRVYKMYQDGELEGWERDNVSTQRNRGKANNRIKSQQRRLVAEREEYGRYDDEDEDEEYEYEEEYEDEEYEEVRGETMQPLNYILIGGIIVMGLSNLF